MGDNLAEQQKTNEFKNIYKNINKYIHILNTRSCESFFLFLLLAHDSPINMDDFGLHL